MHITSHIIRALTFLVISSAWYFNLVLLAGPLTIWYVYNYRAYELIALGLLIDVYFLAQVSVPYYTLIFLAVVLLCEWLKPQLRKQGVYEI